MIEQLIQYRQGETMRTCIRSSYFLILFTIFSISILLSSAVAQSLPVVQGIYGSPSLPVVQGTYGSPPGQGLSPSQSALEAAKRAKQEAEQQVTTAQSALEQANAARLAAEEQLASAQTALETATAAEQAALAANAEQLQVAEQAQTDAKQQLASAQTTLDSANTKLQELEQQIADARTKVAEANEAKRLAEQALAKAVNDVRKIKGEPALPVVGGNYSGPPGDGGNDQLSQLPLTDTDPPILVASRIRDLPVTGWYTASHPVGSHMIELTEKCAEAVDVGDSIDVQVWSRATAQTSNPSCTRLFDILKVVVTDSDGNAKLERFRDRVVREQSRPKSTQGRRYDLAYAGINNTISSIR
jgi:hypothetical protein